MVYLNRIYTRSGDAGETSLGDGERIPKTHPRIIAYGGVDELNALLGVVLSSDLPTEFQERLRRIQNDLFDLGADLCVPEKESPPVHPPLRMTESQVSRLESWIDEATAELAPLESFILPGGSAASAHLHHARTVCRRVEIGVWQLKETSGEPVNPLVLSYLNRLSDLLFVWARKCNNGGRDDIQWVPGEDR